MSDTTLLIDSTTVMPRDLIEEHGITVIPIPINAQGREYRDGVDITPEEFCTMLETLKKRPSTAVPGPGEFVSYYEQLLQKHDNIVYPTPTSRFTGVFNAAVQSAREVKDAKVVIIDPPEELKEEKLCIVHSKDSQIDDKLAEIGRLTDPIIAVMDTGYVSGAAGLIAIEVLNAIHEGRSIDKILKRMIDAKARAGIYFVLNTLEYIVDRVGTLQVFVGALLRIKPVLTLEDGYIRDVAKVRSEGKAREEMIRLVKNRVGNNEVDVYVLHSLVEEQAKNFLRQITNEFNVRNSYLGSIGASVSRYTGRGGLAIAYMTI